MLTSPVVVSQNDLCLVRVNVKGVPPGTDFICLPDTARVNGVAIESILTTLEDDGSCRIAIQNLTNYPLSLKSGVALGDILPYPAHFTPLDSSSCHAILSSTHTSPEHDSVPEDSSVPQPLLDHHLGSVDFLKRKRFAFTSHGFQTVCFVAW